MIQINLLPDVKQEYIRARKQRNTAIFISVAVAAASVAVVVVIGLVIGGQYVLGLTRDNAIKDEYAKLSSESDLSNLVTIQNQLSIVSGQNDKRSMQSRVFNVISVVNPTGSNSVAFSEISVLPETSTLILRGQTANGYAAVERLQKTLENTNLEYTTSADSTTVTEPLVNSVEITDVGYARDSSGNKVVSFMITAEYNSHLFSNEARTARVVGPTGSIDVTDSKLSVPESIFTSPATTDESGGN